MWGNDKDTVLETGHVIMHCEHGLEYCHECPRDFRDMNAEARRDSEAQLSSTAARREQRQTEKAPCHAPGCEEVGASLCSRCRKVGYCSKEHQRADWGRHKKECKPSLPSFTNSISKQVVASYPVGTRVQMVGGMSPLTAKILKFNPPGTGRPSDSSAENLATYTLKVVGESDAETWDEPCEDVHEDWQRLFD